MIAAVGARVVLIAVVALLLAAMPATADALAGVEVHWDTLAGSAYKRAGDYVSDFSPSDGSNGSWQLLSAANGVPELGFVKVRNTGSGTVEPHWDVLSNGSYRRAGDYVSDFSPADAANGSFQLFGSAGGAPELGFVKVRNTVSGTIEPHWDVLSNGSYRRAGDYASDFSLGDGGNGVWQLFSGSGAPELGFVKLTTPAAVPAPAPPNPPPAVEPGVTVIPPPRARRHVKVRITIAWTWRGKYTRLNRIRVGRLPRRGRLTIACRGRGCPKPHARAASRGGERSLLAALAGSRYRAGDRIFIEVAVPGLVPERAEILIRAGRIPKVRLL